MLRTAWEGTARDREHVRAVRGELLAAGEGKERHARDRTLSALSMHSLSFLELSPSRQTLLAVCAGAFVAFGAILSVVLSDGLSERGAARFMTGVGFAGGFSLVVLTGSALYTEVNVSLSVALLRCGPRVAAPIARFWVRVFFANFVGALLVALMMEGAGALDSDQLETLAGVISKKLKEAGDKSGAAWFRVVLSGVLANWLVGLAGYIASTARSVPAKVIGVFFPIVAFSAIGFQHSPANMGYLLLGIMTLGTAPASAPLLTWSNAVLWNILPAAIGNFLGGATLVGGAFFFALSPPGYSTAAGAKAANGPLEGSGATDVEMAKPPVEL